MNKEYDVLVVGELNIDIILNKMDQFPMIGKEVLAEQLKITLGSSSAIFASNISTLGSSVAFLGKLGIDNFGDQIILNLKSRGVDTDFILRSEHDRTGVTVAFNFNEERAMVTYPGAMKNLTIQDVNNDALLQSRHLHVSSVFLQTRLVKDIVQLFKSAKEMGLTTSMDPQWDPAEEWDIDLNDLMKYVDVFLPNATELMALTHTNDLQQALKFIQKFKNTIVVKDGSNGAFLWSGSKLIHQVAFLNTQVVDSIGAGDSFDAGFIHLYIKQKPLAECLEFGALTGAINTCREGGTGAFEDITLVKTIAQSTFNYAII